MLREANPLLEAREVSFDYGTGRALNRVSFFVEKGERLAILGHNGSGKSTLARIIGGLVEPMSGLCAFKGTDLREIEFRELRNRIGLVFQDPENQIVASIVEDDVAFAPENQGLPPDEIQLRVDAALAEADLLKKRNSAVYALSGGEKQRVAIAGILAANVECLILDEPTAMLDPESRLNIEKILRFLHGEGMTIVQITHQIEAESFSDIQRVIVLSKGRIEWEGSTADFWNEAERLGFELPDSLKLERFCKSQNIDIYSLTPKPHCALVTDTSSLKSKFSVKRLSFSHEAESYALKNVDAEIYSGEWLSIIGRTGSGKSTLVQHLNALYKIQEGEILFDGQPLAQKGRGLQTLRRRVGLVFQNPEDQLFSSTVKDELAFAPKNGGFSGKELDDAVNFGLECVG
ncbi:MAG: ATP-binding cassette domain-containing protein, partial [Synergistaceae bacterium]|nr:ATP-binding cassette domain-containing protein [Synergistaceae bacterium]